MRLAQSPLLWGSEGFSKDFKESSESKGAHPSHSQKARMGQSQKCPPPRGTEGSNPPPSSGESGANLTSSIMLGYARSDSGPCRLGPTHAVIALVPAPGSPLADSHVAAPRGRSEEWYYKRGFWPRPFHYTEENRQRMLDPI